MLKIIRWVFVINIVFVLSACKEEQVQADCTSEISEALEHAKNTKKAIRKGKTTEQKTTKKFKRPAVEKNFKNAWLDKKRLEVLNLIPEQKTYLTLAKKSFDLKTIELNKQNDEISQLLDDALRSGDMDTIKEVLFEKNQLSQDLNNHKLDYKVSVLSQLNQEQLKLITERRGLMNNILGLKPNYMNNGQRKNKSKGNSKRRKSEIKLEKG